MTEPELGNRVTSKFNCLEVAMPAVIKQPQTAALAMVAPDVFPIVAQGTPTANEPL